MSVPRSNASDHSSSSRDSKRSKKERKPLDAQSFRSDASDHSSLDSRGSSSKLAQHSPQLRKVLDSQFFRTKLCSFYAKGKCMRGASCSFAHCQSQLEIAPDLKKTSVCNDWKNGCCMVPAELCPYAHGDVELKTTTAFKGQKLSRRTKETREETLRNQVEAPSQPETPPSSVRSTTPPSSVGSPTPSSIDPSEFMRTTSCPDVVDAKPVVPFQNMLASFNKNQVNTATNYQKENNMDDQAGAQVAMMAMLAPILMQRNPHMLQAVLVAAQPSAYED
jgi:hypothetical protein